MISGTMVSGMNNNDGEVVREIDNSSSVSLIIVESGNNLSLIRQTVETIYHRTDYSNYEFLFVCDTSDSSIIDFLQRVPKSRILYNERHESLARNRNKAAFNSSCEYLCFLDSDIIVNESSWLSRMISLYESDNLTGIVGRGANTVGAVCWLHPSGLVTYSALSIDDKKRYGKPLEVMMVMGHNMLMKRNIFHEVGGFDEGFDPLNGEDADICIRTFLSGYKIMDLYVDVEHVGAQGINNSVCRFSLEKRQALIIASQRRLAFKYAPILPTRPLLYHHDTPSFLNHLRSNVKKYLDNLPVLPSTINADGKINKLYLPLPEFEYCEAASDVWANPTNDILEQLYEEPII